MGIKAVINEIFTRERFESFFVNGKTYQMRPFRFLPFFVKEWLYKRRINKIEALKKKCADEMNEFIKNKGGDAWILACESQNMYDVVPLNCKSRLSVARGKKYKDYKI